MKESLKELERYIKKSVKGKLKFSKALVIAFLITGVFSNINYGAWFAVNQEGGGSAGASKSYGRHGENNNKGNVVIASNKTENTHYIQNSVIIGAGEAYGGYEQTGQAYEIPGIVVVGYASKGIGNESIVVGSESSAKDSQAIVLGAKSHANKQAVAIGADTYAYGDSSIAIGNDDISKYQDDLEEETIKKIFSKLYTEKKYTFNTTTKNESMISEENFSKKYIKDDHNGSLRHYSPTASLGEGSIAIGSRAIAYGDGSTSMGTLSMALAEGSTALGLRSYVHLAANSGMALGNETRVYATNSVAVGKNNEATNEGAMAYGYNAKAVGKGSIAIGTRVFSNAKLKSDVKEEITKELSKNNENGDSSIIEQTLNKLKSYNFDEKINDNKFSNKPMFEEESETIISYDRKKIKKIQKNKDGGIVIGKNSFAIGENSLVLGTLSGAFADNSVSLGSFSYASEEAENSIAIGVGANVNQKNSVSLGTFAYSNKENTVAIGTSAKVTLENSTAIGYQSKTDYTDKDLMEKPYTPNGAIVIPTSNKVGVISVGSKDYERRIINVAAGSKPKDAVNVEQLKALESRIDLITNNKENIIPYFGVDQTSQDSEAKRISQGQNALLTYERYVYLSGEYAKLLNRKVNGAEEFNEESLKQIKEEIEKLNIEENTKENAKGIKDIIEELTNESSSNSKKEKNEFELKKELSMIEDAIKLAMDKKDSVSNLTEEEIKASNYKGNLAIGKDSIAIGFKAKAQGNESVAIGKGAIVETKAGDSIALGKNSEAKEKEQALDGLEANGIKFEWKNAGTSKDNTDDNKKSVLSIGSNGNERIIKNVATGKVQEGSTDAINGGQLKSVIDVFGKLGIDVLGAEVNKEGEELKVGFKKTTFTKLKDANKEETQVKSFNTFKEAIEGNIDKLNEGIKFAVDTTDNTSSKEYTSYLGSTIKFKGDTYITPSIDNSGVITFKANVATNIDNTNNTNSGSSTQASDKLVTESAVKQYITTKLSNVATSFKVAGNSGEYTITDKLTIKGKEEEKNKNKYTNITTEAKGNELKISLNKDLKGINSIGKNLNDKVKSKITFNDSKNKHNDIKANVVISSNGGKFIFDRTGLHINEREITGVKSSLFDDKDTSKNEETLKNILEGKTMKDKKDVSKNVVNVKDLSEVAKALVGKIEETTTNLTNNDKLSLKYDNDKKDTITLGGKDNTTKVTLTNLKEALELKEDDSKSEEEKIKEVIKELITKKDNLTQAVTLKDLQTISKAGLNFKGNDEEEIHKNLSETLEIKGKGYKKESFEGTDNNIAVLVETPKETTSTPKLEISLNKDLTNMNSFETKEKKSKLDTNGLMVKDNDKNVSFTKSTGLNVGTLKDDSSEIDDTKSNATYTKDGMTLLGEKENDKQSKAEYKLTETKLTDKDGNISTLTPTEISLKDKDNKGVELTKNSLTFTNNDGVISGLKAPEKATDVVNKEYVDNIKGNVDKEITTLKEVANENIDSLKGGIAGVIAMANLPQISTKGHNIGAAIGQHKDKVALALGISGTNEKGNLVYKASGSITSKADISLGAGIGYQFGYKEDKKQIIDVKQIKAKLNKHDKEIKNLKEEVKKIKKLENENDNLKEKMLNMLKEIETLKEMLKKINNK